MIVQNLNNKCLCVPETDIQAQSRFHGFQKQTIRTPNEITPVI